LTVQIARVRTPTRTEFVDGYMRGGGTPVVITGAIDRWPARTKWTFAFFKEVYGADMVCPEIGLASGIGRITRLATYIDYLDTPDQQLEGFWASVADGRPLRATDDIPEGRPYLVEWNAFRKHPELLADVQPPLDVTGDWTALLPSPLRSWLERRFARHYFDVLVGPPGSISALHFDFGHTFSFLSQIAGRKRVMLFSPADTPFLYHGQVNPEAPDPAHHPLFEQATPYEAILEPGDVLFTPPDWWHQARALDKSITCSLNFFNGANVVAHLSALLKRMRRR